mmetsp:Transcript_13/g.55  ORF Transcript_13/g.55 Transcript_13/m.55 type:complete len:249 (-) Transcript_13:146-892(-)
MTETFPSTPTFHEIPGVVALMAYSFQRKEKYWKTSTGTPFSLCIGDCYNGLFQFRKLYGTQCGFCEWNILPTFYTDNSTSADHFFLLLSYPTKDIIIDPTFPTFCAAIILDRSGHDHVPQFYYFSDILSQIENLLVVPKFEFKKLRVFDLEYVDGRICFGFKTGSKKKTPLEMRYLDYSNRTLMDNPDFQLNATIRLSPRLELQSMHHRYKIVLTQDSISFHSKEENEEDSHEVISLPRTSIQHFWGL